MLNGRNSRLLSLANVLELQLGCKGTTVMPGLARTYRFQLNEKLVRKDFLKMHQELRERRVRVMPGRGADLGMAQASIL